MVSEISKPRLLFVSPRFLFPADSGGKIRTTQILKGLKGGVFHIVLVSPCHETDPSEQHSEDIDNICDEFVSWNASNLSRVLLFFKRLFYFFGSLPIPVATDKSRLGRKAVEKELKRSPDIVIFDFPHASILAPKCGLKVPSVMFTHNVESLIFERHADVAGSLLMKLFWKNQLRKMKTFERDSLSQYSTVIAVSQKDVDWFSGHFGFNNVSVIPTGVDLEFYQYFPPSKKKRAVFIGSMDWLANIDGISFLIDDIWPLVLKTVPDAEMCVVGRNPPDWLVKKVASEKLNWHFTGYVESVKPYVKDSCVCLIPLRVGGGTRIKVFEAMAMGSPVISTDIGVEGLPILPGEHYLEANSPEDFAAEIVRVMRDTNLAKELSINARNYVAAHFSQKNTVRIFENICLNTLEKSDSRH